MKKQNKLKSIKLFLVSLLVFNLGVYAIPSNVLAAQAKVDLGTASSFGVLAGSTITNTGPTTIDGTAGGDIGLDPGDDPTIATFPGQEDITTTGTVHLFDGVASSAKDDLLIAYNDAAGRVTTETISGDLAGRTLTPGVYTSGSSIGLSGTLTLDAGGDPNAVFIFQAGTTLTTASDSEIILINDAQPCRVFWQVGSSATLGTGSDFVGHILASESITATTGVTVLGSLLALNGAVTLDTNVITNDDCLAAGSLRVSKILEGSVTGMTLPEFEITVTGPYEFSDTQIIQGGSSYIWEGLSSGTYTVSEVQLGEDWSVTGTGDYSVQLGNRTEVNVTNVYEGSAVLPIAGDELPQTGGSAILYYGFISILVGVSILSIWKYSMISKENHK